MAYYPKDRNPSGVFYYGQAGSDQVLETNSTFTYDTSTNVVNATATGITVGGINNQIEAPTGNGSDYMLIASGSALRKLALSNLSASLGGGTMNNWLVSADGGSTQTVSDTNQVDFSGAGNITITQDESSSPYRVVISGNDQVNTYTAGSGLNEDPSNTFNVQTDNSTLEISTDTVRVKNAGITPTQIATSVAGNGLTGGAGSALAVGAGSLIDVTATTVDVNLTEAAAATIADNDELIFLDGGVTESKGSTRDLASLFAGAGLIATNSTLSTSGITVQGDSGSTTLSLGETLDIGGGSGILTTVSAGSPEQVTVDLTVTSVTAGSYGSSTAVGTFTVDANGRLTAASNVNIADLNIAADVGTSDPISLGETLTIAGGSGIETNRDANNQITINATLLTVSSGTLAGDSELLNDVNVLDVAGGSESYGLPATPPPGQLIRVKKGDSSANTITITGNAGKPIDGGSSYILYNQWESVTFISEEDGWFVF